MPIEDALTDITARLRQGKFPNEQAVSQGIVLRLLQELGWNTYDTSVVWPEFSTGEGRCDFALCHPACKPVVFIEVKQPNRAEDAVRQALEYAFHTGGVPFVVLTDGKTWGFYLPTATGFPAVRRSVGGNFYDPDGDVSEPLFAAMMKDVLEFTPRLKNGGPGEVRGIRVLPR